MKRNNSRVNRGTTRKRARKKAVRRIKLISLLIIFLLGIFLLTQAPLAQKLYYPYPYRPIIEKYSTMYGVDPLLVISVIRAESKFLPTSESHKGAQGLMQLMPETAQWIAESIGDKDFKQSDLAEPAKNIQYGVWYIANLQKEFDDMTLVLAAYNGGRGHVKKWIQTEQLNLADLRAEDIPFKETREYVDRVKGYYSKYIAVYAE